MLITVLAALVLYMSLSFQHLLHGCFPFSVFLFSCFAKSLDIMKLMDFWVVDIFNKFYVAPFELFISFVDR